MTVPSPTEDTQDQTGALPLPEQGAGPYSIGSDVWPGLSKLTEECGEVLQVVGKIIGAGGAPSHWDGQRLADALADELADLSAAIKYVIAHNAMPATYIDNRVSAKFAKFRDWHESSFPTTAAMEI